MHKIPFTLEENNIFNNLEVIENKRKKLMSVYSYLIKYSPDRKLIKPIAFLYDLYVRSHYKMSLAYFKRLISELAEAGLVIVDKSKSRYKYFIPRKVAEKVAEKVANNEVAQSIENTNSDNNFKKHKYRIINNTNTITVNTNPMEFVSCEKLIEIARGLFREYKIKSTGVKEMVISKLSLVNNVLYTGAVQYVTKVIAEKKAIQEANRELYRRVLNKVKASKIASSTTLNKYGKSDDKQLKFNNFQARDMYSNADTMQCVEDVLCGYSSIDTLRCYNLC